MCVCVCVEKDCGGGVGVCVYPCAVMSGRAADTAMVTQDQLDLERHH